MEKIKLVTDTACDIPLERAKELGIEVISFLITANGETFRERRDKTNEEFYDILLNCDSIPTTAGINPFEFEELYLKFAKEGYEDIIYVSINGKGSSTNQSAHTAIGNFYDENPEYKDKVRIHVVDSTCYSLGYGLPLIQAAGMVQNGKTADEIVDYLTDYFEHQRTYFCTYTLDFAKKSGRISCAAAIVGGILGIKPVMCIEHSAITVAGKARNGKAAMLDMVARTEKEIKPGTPYCIVAGNHPEHGEEIKAMLLEKLGYPAQDIFYVGAAVAANAGPEVCGVSFYRKDN